MRTLAFFLEEPSARIMLEGILPRLIDADIDVRYVVFEGKQDLEKNLVKRLRFWQTPNTDFIVLRDQDSADCREVKRQLQKLCAQAGRPDVLVRVACRELESFYLGDLLAVEQGLNLKGLAKQQARHKFREPDQLGNPVQELKRLTAGCYQKLQGSRDIAPYLRLQGESRSRSFNVLIAGVRRRI